jgi:cytochrome c peroxidase
MTLRSAIGAAVLAAYALLPLGAAAADWTEEELAVLRSLSLTTLPPLPDDPGNPVADDPRAVDLGHRLFFDTRLSANGEVACASCHQPERYFTDGETVAHGLGATIRNAPTVVGAAYSPWFFWDGRKDSLWSQALAPIENPLEHGMSRAAAIELVRGDPDYARRYRDLFGPLPDAGDAQETSRAFASLGRAIAAYERKLLPGPARFDRYVDAVLAGVTPAPDAALSPDEIRGLRAFMADDQGRCLRCHNGPLFTDFHFHNIGADVITHPHEERGRFDGVRLALADEFNCLGAFSGASPAACAELRFAKRDVDELLGAFKTPTLRSISKTAPYMHRGQHAWLELAVRHYSTVPPSAVGKSELEPSTIPPADFDKIAAFLLTLDSPIAAPASLLRAPTQE